jgi:hypothetical protein
LVMQMAIIEVAAWILKRPRQVWQLAPREFCKRR